MDTAAGGRTPFGAMGYAADSLKGRVVGVVRNFNYESLRSKVKPLVLLCGNWGLLLVVRISPKEIGIRKVLGASVGGIMYGLSKELVKLVVLANAVALPAAYYLMNNWLEDFAYRVNINVWTFLVSGLTVLSIAIITVGAHAIKAATANPVESLRYE